MKARRGLLIAAMVLLAGALAAQQSPYWCPAQGVAYGVSLKRAGEHIVHVDAVAHQPADRFQLPVWNALYQVRDFAVNVNRVKAFEGVPEWMCDRCETKDAQVEKLDKATWKLTTSGDYPCVTFSYDVLANDEGAFGASLDSKYGFFNWAEVLVYRPEDRKAPVSIRVMDATAGWKLHDGGVIGAHAADELADVPATAFGYDQLVDSPALLGKLYESSFEQDGAKYEVVVDSPDVDLAALRTMLKKITAAGVDWMQDRPYDEYTFLYLVANGSGSGGMEHAYSSAIDVAGGRMVQDVTSAAGVSAHEFFHLWNVKRIRPQSLEPIDYTKEQYSRALWFSEGMTSTAADILQFRAGLTDEKQSLAHLAAVIGGLQARSARLTQSVEESSLDTWFDVYASYHRADRSISYYSKGEILGFLIDLEMRRLTNGHRCVRDLFQYMNQRYAKQGKYFDDSEGVRAGLEELTGNDFKEFFARYISGTDELPYQQAFTYVGLTLGHRQGEQPYAGFASSRAPGRPTTITRVDESSTAARLHLVEGDVILEADGKKVVGDFNQVLQKHDAKKNIRLKVRSAAGEVRELELPVGTRKIDEYQFEDLPDVSQAVRNRRAAFLRGEAETGATQ